MNFFKKIADSVYNPSFYSGLKETRLRSAYGYYYSLTAVVSLIVAFVFGIQTSAIFSADNLKRAVNFFPSELTITMKSGTVSTNVPEPYSIRETNESSSGQKYTNLVVFDTKNDFSVENFRKYDTRVLVGKNYVVTSKNGGQFEFNDISKVPDFTLNQQKLFNWIGKIDSNHLLISISLFFMWFVGHLFVFSLWLIWVAILALLVMAMLKFKGLEYSYKDSYKVSLHAVTLAVLIYMVSATLSVGIGFTFFNTLVSLAVVFFNFKKMEAPKIIPPTQG